MPDQGHLYFHSPCFDGIVSATLAWDFLESRFGWSTVVLHSVNYDLRQTWLSSSLEKPSAVVDFLYHTETDLWADHHVTTFVNEAARADYQKRRGPSLVYDEDSESCAGLLWAHLARVFGHRNPSYADAVRWAEKVDAARYESVEEALFSTTPALRISAGLALGDGEAYCEGLVRAFRGATLDEVASLPEVMARYEQAQRLTRIGLDRLAASCRITRDGIAVYDVDSSGAIINRYAPFFFFPNARYSVGLTRRSDGARITAMRNPWQEFESVPLGRISEGLGGGGHQRVGSIVVRGRNVDKARSIMRRFISEIRRKERPPEQRQIA